MIIDASDSLCGGIRHFAMPTLTVELGIPFSVRCAMIISLMGRANGEIIHGADKYIAQWIKEGCPAGE